MSQEDFSDFRRFVAAAKEQETDREASRERSRRAAWWVAGGACAMSAALTVAVVVLSQPKPLPEPVILRFDSATGIVDAAVPYRDQTKISMQEQTLRGDLARYVKLRREYFHPLLQRSFGSLVALSDEKVSEELRREWAFDNPRSPFATYGDKNVAEVAIRSRTIIAPNVGQVRYTLTETINGKKVDSYHVATIGYNYGELLKTEAERDINPLGFRVTSWKTDFEAGAK